MVATPLIHRLIHINVLTSESHIGCAYTQRVWPHDIKSSICLACICDKTKKIFREKKMKEVDALYYDNT